VGVGQSEIEIMQLADTVVVVLNPGTGDGIQAIKAGIMEIADIFVINKADLNGAERLKNDIEMMLSMSGSRQNWRPSIILTSIIDNRGFDELKQIITAAIILTLTFISFRLPTGRNTPLSKIRNSLTCMAGLISPTSSIKNVPLLAISNKPCLAF